jgi:long-chain acyl-CoA synthetase
VALMMPNGLEFIEIVAGLSELGAVVVTLGAYLSPSELAAQMADSQASAMIVHGALAEMALDASGLPPDRIVVLGPAYEDWLTRASDAAWVSDVQESDSFAMSYTSGTTGRPKGVLISHRSRALTFAAMAVEYGCYGPDDRALTVAPMFHGAGFAFAAAPLVFGGTVEILTRFEPESVLRRLVEGAATNLFVVPTHLHGLFGLPPAVLEACRADALKTLICNAAPLPTALKEQALAHFGPGRLFECYGSTEGGIISNLRPADQSRKQQCVGQPFPWTEIRLLDDDGADVAAGETGEIHTRSPFFFNGYWRQPEATAEALRGGWLTVGDLGRFDDEGHLYIVGRKKDMILTGGINVYPREIEDLLATHPRVAEACVVGLPDAQWGERVVAGLVLRDPAPGGGSDTTGLMQELAEQARLHLAPPKRPKQFVVIDQVPRNASGKVLKRVLQEQLIHVPASPDSKET